MCCDREVAEWLSGQVAEKEGPREGRSGRVAQWPSGQVFQPTAYSLQPTASAFSLVEMMVVLILIGLLASVVTINVRGYLVRGRQDTVRLELATIRDGLETYYGMVGRYPTNEEGLELLTQTSEKLPEPILSHVPVDPWGQPYQYHSPGKDNRPYEVVCYGADGREGGEAADADVNNWDLKAARASAQSEAK